MLKIQASKFNWHLWNNKAHKYRHRPKWLALLLL